jgi:hypothetical protein
MKTTLPFLFLLSVLLILCSCHFDNRFPYAIRDFRSSLQPYLTKAVNRGFVSYEDDLANVATNRELMHLTKSEHPILRTIAFRDLLKQLNSDHFDLIMDNLNDTALVAIERGEFGLYNKMISDYIIENGKWRTVADRNKTADEIIMKHSYLASASGAANLLGPQEKYYGIVKQMVQQNGSGLYSLARFKKKEDILLIKNTLLNKVHHFDTFSFAIMDDFPNDAYIEVYQSCYPASFYRCLIKDPNSEVLSDFINSVAKLKNEVSANILDSVLHFKPNWKGMIPKNVIEFPDSYWKYQIYSAINSNKCKAYAKLQKDAEAYLTAYDKKYPGIPLTITPPEDLHIPTDTLETVKWYDE